MRRILYTQYYRARTPERQAELDHCLLSNLQHPVLDQVVLLREPDAPELPGPARMPVRELVQAERLTYARWMQMLREEADAIGILINSDIALGEGWQHLEEVLNTPQSVVALSRYNPQGPGEPARLNRFPHWTQDTWALRSDAPIPDSLMYASTFPIGYPGCDNRIAYVFWSHGLEVKNPCYHLETLHHQADVARAYDKNGDRLYGGTSYVHPVLSLEEPSELEHTIWTRSFDPCPGVLVNQQAVDRGVHQLLGKDEELGHVFKEHHKSTGLAWANPPIGCARSDHASTWPIPELMQPEGVLLDLGGQRRVKGLQLRLPRTVSGQWLLELEGRRQAWGSWEVLDVGPAAQMKGDGRRRFLEANVLQEPWLQMKLRLKQHSRPEAEPPGMAHLVEVLVFAEKRHEERRPVALKATAADSGPRRLQLKLREKRLELVKALDAQNWSEVHRYSNRFSLRAQKGRIAFVDRFWPSALTFRDPELSEWDGKALGEAFLWGFVNPVLEWKPNQFAPEKQYPEQLNFWQYPCRTEQDAFERHQRIEEPFRDSAGAHVYVGLPWATWIDKKTFPDQLLEAISSRLEAVKELLDCPLQVHSVCQHIRWKEHPHRFEQAGITHLWIAHKEKGWDREGQLRLHAWPLYAVNVLDPARREGLEIVPVEKKSVFASFKGAHMKHYPTDVRLRLKELAHLEGYEIEVTDLWHFNKVVYNYQIANKQSDKEAIEKEEIISYNQLLSRTLYSLCPAGAGPNTLRLWESLGAGSIPVVLSDIYEFPTIPQAGGQEADWNTAIIQFPEDNLSTLANSLSAIGIETAREMQERCIALHQALLTKTCFSTPQEADKGNAVHQVHSPGQAVNESTTQKALEPIKKRLLVIGSSISIQKEGYLPLLKEVALSKYDVNLEVLNASLGGCSTEASLAYLKSNLFYNVKDFAADVALIEKTPNERHYSFARLTLHQQQAYEDKIYSDTLELIQWCLVNQMQPVLLCSYFKPSASASWEATEANGYLRRCYEKVSERTGVPLIDINTLMHNEYHPDELLLDDVHLNRNGSMIMAQAVGNKLFGVNLSADYQPGNCESIFANDKEGLQILFKGSTEIFSTRLLTASYDKIGGTGKQELMVHVNGETSLTGFFFISDQDSVALKIMPDNDESRSLVVHTFDHMSFLPRVTYKSIADTTACHQFRFIQHEAFIDLDATIDAYHNSKTFNPKEEWAQMKYLRPLLERREGKRSTCEKIIAVFGRPIE